MKIKLLRLIVWNFIYGVSGNSEQKMLGETLFEIRTTVFRNAHNLKIFVITLSKAELFSNFLHLLFIKICYAGQKNRRKCQDLKKISSIHIDIKKKFFIPTCHIIFSRRNLS